jgi:hypothetical protein
MHKPRPRAKHRSTRKCPLTRDVIRGFNRDTAWLATGVLGALVLATLMLAVEEDKSKPMLAGRDFLVNVNPATMASVIAESSDTTGETYPPLHEISSTQAPAPNTRKIRSRSSVVSRFIDVKRRLIELWHQSLARDKTRNWTTFSTLSSRARKQAAYTSETNQ